LKTLALCFLFVLSLYCTKEKDIMETKAQEIALVYGKKVEGTFDGPFLNLPNGERLMGKYRQGYSGQKLYEMAVWFGAADKNGVRKPQSSIVWNSGQHKDPNRYLISVIFPT